jgi:aerobic carbon-monoxide dehydrogenase large subunit
MTNFENSKATGMGDPVRRVEDKRFLTGTGRFVDDLAPPGMAIACFVRSPHAHARILGIETAAAKLSPGVLAILTGEDALRENLGHLECHSFPQSPPGFPSFCPTQPLLAAEKVRYVGEAVALVIAETNAAAKDAVELVEVRYDPIPAVTLIDAHAADAPKVWKEADGNTGFVIESGDAATVDAQFAAAAHVSTIQVSYPRATANSMEPRTALAWREPMDGRFTLCTSAQEPHSVKQTVSQILGIPLQDVRVVAMDVGGAFGMKGQTYPEEALVLWAARKLDRPVKWTAERSEAIATDMHGRGPISDSALALDADGRILAFRTSASVDLGAYLSSFAGVPPRNGAISFPGTYHIPVIHALVRATFTNTSLLGPYRGSGKPEATYVLERLIEQAAREMGIDPIDMRRRNLIPPTAMPYQTAGGYVYDTGNFEAVLDRALELSDWNGFDARRAETEQRGLRRGIGLALHCQRAGTFSERMEIRIGQDGSAALHVGTLSTGQGHETMFAQMVSGWLGLPLSNIRVFQGDTDKVLFGRGTFAQRSMSTGGSALRKAADAVIEKGRRISAWMMEASEEDIDFADGVFSVTGTDRYVSFRDVAAASYRGSGLPSELGVGLDGVGTNEQAYSFPNGCMIAEIEVDTDTGTLRVDRLSAVDDVGVVVNPMTLEGQLHGSIAQGLGESLTEQILYDRESGQLLTGSFLDYGMPRADMMPDIRHDLSLVPSKNNLLGVKGGSEAGNCGVPPAVAHALLDALSAWHLTDIQLPATPERVWQAIRGAQEQPKPL